MKESKRKNEEKERWKKEERKMKKIDLYYLV